MASRIHSAQAIKPALHRHAWARNKQGPLPQAAAGRARIAHTRACTSVPRLLFKYALQARRARHFPAVPVLPFELTALPRCLILFRLDLCHTTGAFCQPKPRIAAVHPYSRRRRFASGSRLSPHACMHAAPLRSPTSPRYNNTTAQMPARRPVLLTI
jgi:hypothetical protein